MEKKWKKQEERQEIAAGLQQKTEKMCLQKGFCVSSNENQVPYIKYVHTKKSIIDTSDYKEKTNE